MMKNAAKLLFILVLLATSLGHAEECKPLESIQMSGFALEEFFNPLENPGPNFIPAPTTVCLKQGRTIRISDPYGRVAGIFQIEQVWQGKYTLSTLANLKTSDVPKEYESYLSKKKLRETSLQAFLQLVFSFPIKLNKEEVQIARGRFKLLSDYVLNWNPKTEPRNVKDTKVIGYEEVIARVGTESVIIDAIPNIRPDLWRIPGAIRLPISNLKAPCGLWTWQTLVDNWRSIDMKAHQQAMSLPAVVYSTHVDPSCALNAIAFLKMHGFQDVQWYELGSRDWEKGSLHAEKERDLNGQSTVKAADVLRALSDKSYAVIDIRSPQLFAIEHIKGAVNNYLDIVEVREVKKIAQTNPAIAGMVSSNVTLASVFLTPLASQIKEANNIIFYTDSFYAQDLKSAVRDVRRHFPRDKQPNVYVYPEGLAEWIAHTKWLLRYGYEIQANTP